MAGPLIRVDAGQPTTPEIKQFTGMFHMSAGTKGQRFAHLATEAVKQFVDHYQKQGYTLDDRPFVERISEWVPGYKPRRSSDGKATLYVPTGSGLTPNDPLYVPGADQYRVTATFSRRARNVTQDIPEAQLKRIAVPSSLRIME